MHDFADLLTNPQPTSGIDLTLRPRSRAWMQGGLFISQVFRRRDSAKLPIASASGWMFFAIFIENCHLLIAFRGPLTTFPRKFTKRELTRDNPENRTELEIAGDNYAFLILIKQN